MHICEDGSSSESISLDAALTASLSTACPTTVETTTKDNDNNTVCPPMVEIPTELDLIKEIKSEPVSIMPINILKNQRSTITLTIDDGDDSDSDDTTDSEQNQVQDDNGCQEVLSTSLHTALNIKSEPMDEPKSLEQMALEGKLKMLFC